MLGALATVVDEVVVTVNDSVRCLPADELAERARAFWSPDAVHVVADFDAAMVMGRDLAGPTGCSLATGSVVTAGLARSWAENA
jgi:dihydrofolate synthase/folylpolyglutamate synthase